jgi:subtilisin-like proprotein convertase family protein
LNLTVGDAETAAGSLTVSGSSSNPTLVPNANIVFGGSGSNRTVTVTGAAGQTGTATITVSVSDGQLSANSSFVLTVNASTTGTLSLTNATLITIPDVGQGTPYPSSITVSGMGGTITQVTVTLNNLTHTFPSDIDIMLLGPNGQGVMIFSDVGGSSSMSGVTVTLSDNASSSLPINGRIKTGTYKPTDAEPGDSMLAPAPAAPYGATLSTFNGISANGTWSLYVLDDGTGDSGTISDGWVLQLTTQ